MIKYYQIQNEKIIVSDEKNARLILYIKPSTEEIKEISLKHKIDEYLISSSLDPDELARLEFEDDYKMILIKRPKNYSSEHNLVFQIFSIGLFIFKSKLVIIMSDDVEIITFKQTKKMKTIMDVLIKIIMGTISHFLGHLRTINMITESIEQKIDASIDNIYLRHMFAIQKSLVYYLNGINYNGVLFEKIRNISKKIGFTESHLDKLDEIIVENAQCYKQAEIYTNIISGIMNTHASIISNNLNQTIHRLTFITTIFMPLTLIASIGGMSEWTMMTKNISWIISYPIFILGMIIIAIISYFLLKRLSFTSKDKSISLYKKSKKNDNKLFFFWRG
ncbi:MAG: magnesium transporter CorA family protein, partial [Spirochaetes bacterium]|nr:magnesium transporter CorA family protein [Spirochaetota bacterium]